MNQSTTSFDFGPRSIMSPTDNVSWSGIFFRRAIRASYWPAMSPMTFIFRIVVLAYSHALVQRLADASLPGLAMLPDVKVAALGTGCRFPVRMWFYHHRSSSSLSVCAVAIGSPWSRSFRIACAVVPMCSATSRQLHPLDNISAISSLTASL